MNSISDGLSNIEAINAQIAALQQTGGTSSTANSAANTPDTFILQTQQNFNTMLTNLMSDSDSDSGDSGATDPFASLISNQNLQTQLTTAGNSGLTTLNQSSALLGKQAAYQDATGAEVLGVIAKILLDAQGDTLVEMSDGRQVPVGSITRIIQ